LELDHIFLFCTPGDGLEERLKSAGFVETYRRQHPGQGTENICVCFDNAFVELLWVNDTDEIKSAPISRTKLYERSEHVTTGTCPFGIAWRGPSRTPTWQYCPPYLPAHLGIDVAIDSDDPNQPMMFRSPGNSPPTSWPAERRGNLQHRAGFKSVRIRQLSLPLHVSPSPALNTLAKAFDFVVSNLDQDYRLNLEIDRSNGQGPFILQLHWNCSLLVPLQSSK
jgi:hypothetical protein